MDIAGTLHIQAEVVVLLAAAARSLNNWEALSRRRLWPARYQLLLALDSLTARMLSGSRWAIQKHLDPEGM
jgi:hypothetical protein